MPASFPIDVQREWFRDMDGQACIQSDFAEALTFAEGVFAVAAGAFAGVFGPALGDTNDHPGIWVLRTGTTATGRVFIISRVGAYSVGVGGETLFQSWVRVPVLSTAAQRYTARSGFFSISLPNIINQGIGFEYDDSQNGGRWQAITDDGVETSTDTGIAVVADDWYKLSWSCNPDGDAVDFFIGDDLVATNIANIPSGAGFSHFVNVHNMKLIGTTSRDMDVDGYAVFQRTEGRE